MIIKKYLGKTEEEALALAKKELGEQVVLMNVKKVKKGGFFGLLQSFRSVGLYICLYSYSKK